MISQITEERVIVLVEQRAINYTALGLGDIFKSG